MEYAKNNRWSNELRILEIQLHGGPTPRLQSDVYRLMSEDSSLQTACFTISLGMKPTWSVVTPALDIKFSTDNNTCRCQIES